MLASKGIAQGFSKLIVTQNGWRKRSSIICKALSTSTADKSRKDSEEYFDDMRKSFGKQKKRREEFYMLLSYDENRQVVVPESPLVQQLNHR